jgi:hypothetical protein
MDTYYTQETLPVYYKHGDEQVLVGDDGHFYNSNGERVYYWVSSGETAEGGRHEAYLHGQQTGEDHFSRAVSAYVQEGGSGFYTEKEIKNAFHADEGMGKLSSQTSWDNYWGYLQEQQGLIETGQLSTALDAWHRDSRQAQKDVLQAGGGLRAMGGAKGGALGQIRDEGYRNSFNEILNSELQQGLMQKWGIPTEVQTDNGSLYRFNGSTLTKVYEPESFNLASTAAQLGVGVALSAALGPVVGAKIGALTGAAPAGFVGPLSTSQVVGGKVAAGLAAGATSAGTQLLTTGDIDPRSVLTSAVMSGVNPGGYVADNYAPWAPNGQFQLGGAPPSSFYGGLISGTVNDVVKNGLVNGEFDLQDSLEKGLVSGGINSLTNAYQEWNKNSLENLADQVEYTMPGIDRATAESFAAMNPDLNKLDFGALIGEGGLLPFIPKLDVTGIRGITDTVGSAFDGLLNGVELNDQFQLADGSYIDVDKVTPEQEIAALQKYGGFNTLEDRQTIGLLNNPLVNGITNTLGNLMPEGGLSEDLQTQVQLYGSEWDSQNSPNQFNTLDPNAEEYDTSAYYTPEGGLTTAGQVAKNNFIETKITNLGSFDYDLSGGLNENYSWSSNPRGNSELWGTLQNIPGLFSQGSNNLGGAITPPKNPDGSTVKPLNLNGELINPEALVTVDAGGAVLPSNNDSAIRNQNIIDYFDLLNGGLATDSTASATEVDVDTTKDLDKDTASTVSTVSNTSDTSSIDDTLSTNTTKTIDKGDVVTTAVVPEVYVEPEVIVPRTTTLSGGGSPPLNLSGNSDKGLPVLWGMLDPYTKFRGYAKKRQDLYSKMMKSLEAKEPGGMLSGRSTFLTPRERELFEAGEFKR